MLVSLGQTPVRPAAFNVAAFLLRSCFLCIISCPRSIREASTRECSIVAEEELMRNVADRWQHSGFQTLNIEDMTISG